jgi:hypothetical protein
MVCLSGKHERTYPGQKTCAPSQNCKAPASALTYSITCGANPTNHTIEMSVPSQRK